MSQKMMKTIVLIMLVSLLLSTLLAGLSVFL